MPPDRKYRTRAELYVRTALLVFGALLIGFVAINAILAAWRMYGRVESATASADAAARQLAIVTAQDAKIKADIADLSSARGVETALRQRYSVIKPGEGVIEIVDRQGSTTDTAGDQSRGFFGTIIHTLWPW
ncbi:MAG TPA: hypothetical protein VF803_01405 [Candidatus Paceibacterota bacterium]